jgi:hypothetical protein
MAELHTAQADSLVPNLSFPSPEAGSADLCFVKRRVNLAEVSSLGGRQFPSWLVSDQLCSIEGDAVSGAIAPSPSALLAVLLLLAMLLLLASLCTLVSSPSEYLEPSVVASVVSSVGEPTTSILEADNDKTPPSKVAPLPAVL